MEDDRVSTITVCLPGYFRGSQHVFLISIFRVSGRRVVILQNCSEIICWRKKRFKMKVWRCFALKTSYFVMPFSNMTHFLFIYVWKSFEHPFENPFESHVESPFESHVKVFLKVIWKSFWKSIWKSFWKSFATHPSRPTRRDPPAAPSLLSAKAGR